MDDETEQPPKPTSKLVKAKNFAKTLKPIDIFRIIIFVLHVLAACSFSVISLVCNVDGLGQQGTYDAYEPGYHTCDADSGKTCFRTGVPWVDDAELKNHVWNPYQMIFVFEWISASFALFYLRRALPWVKTYHLCVVWDSVGMGLVIIWHVKTGAKGWGQTVLCVISLMFCEFVHWCWDNEITELVAELQVEKQGETGVNLAVVGGRLWRIPVRLSKHPKQLKMKPRSIFGYVGDEVEEVENEEAEEKLLEGKADDTFEWNAIRIEGQLEILLRYMEYLVSAPLLFIAILCMVVVNAPVWMYVGGYTLVQVCNLQGIPLHLMSLLIEDGPRVGPIVSRNVTESSSLWLERNFHTLAGFLGVGKWRDMWVNLLCHMQGAWICMSVALLIIVYVARDIFFSDVLPVQIKLLLWWLVISYASFGVVASIVYGFHVGRSRLDVMLDVLSLLAKIPTPAVVALNYFLKPAGYHPCL